MPVPQTIYLFRMLHIDNLQHALAHGLWTAQSPQANPNYIPIGDSAIISARDEMEVPFGGTLAEYIPFYFCAKPPMLYVIQHGYNMVTPRKATEIAYVVVPLEAIKASQVTWYFTDGNARDYSSRFFQYEKELDQLDWEVIQSQDWKNREDDFDRKRRKQAELLIHKHLSASCISHIIVYEEKKAKFVQELLKQFPLDIQVAASPKHYYT